MIPVGDRTLELDLSGTNNSSGKEKDSSGKDNLHVPDDGLLHVGNTSRMNPKEYEFLMNTNNTEPDRNNILTSLFSDNEEIKIENGCETKAYYEKLKLCELSIVILCLICEVLAIFGYLLEFSEIYEDECQGILWIIMILTGVLGLLLAVNTDGLMFFKYFLIALIQFPRMHIKIDFFVPYENTEVYTKVNEILHLIMLSRVLIAMRTILLFSEWRSSRSQRVCDMYGTKCNYLFVLRCLFQYNSYAVITATGIPSIFFFAFALYMCERPLSRVSFENLYSPSSILSNYNDCMWNVVVTMATVGYGDFFPRTPHGRFIAFILCLWGVLIVSLTVVTLSTLLNISDLEAKAIFLLEKLRIKRQLQVKSGFVLTRFARIGRAFKKKEIIPEEKFKSIKRDLKDVKGIKRHYRSMSMEGNFANKMENYFEIMSDSMKGVENTQQVLLEGYIEIMNSLNLDNAKLVQHRDKLKSKQKKVVSENFDATMVSEDKKSFNVASKPFKTKL